MSWDENQHRSRRQILRQGALAAAALGIPRTGRLWAQQLPGLAVASAGSFCSMLDGPLKDAAARDLHLDLHAHSGGADAMARSLIDGSLSFDDEG